MDMAVVFEIQLIVLNRSSHQAEAKWTVDHTLPITAYMQYDPWNSANIRQLP